MIEFRAPAYFQGSSRTKGVSACITIPTMHRTLKGTFSAPGWLRLRVNGSKPFFALARRSSSRASVDVVLPQYAVGKIRRGTMLTVRAETAASYAARPSRRIFDWLRYLPPHYFAYDDGDDLVICYRRGQARLRRHPPLRDVHWLLGLYQAEGSKRSRLDWSFPSTNRQILAEAIRVLTVMGLRTQLKMQVLHAADDDPAAVRTQFSRLNVPIVSVLPRPKHKTWTYSGGRGAVLRVEQSAPLWYLTTGALAGLFCNGFRSQKAARAFALGWLDGDGSMATRSSIALGLHGTRREAELVVRALHQGFGWQLKELRGPVYGYRRVLTLDESCALARAHGFRFALTRVRLLYAIERRISGLRNAVERTRLECVATPLRRETAQLKRIMPPDRIPARTRCMPYPTAARKRKSPRFPGGLVSSTDAIGLDDRTLQKLNCYG